MCGVTRQSSAKRRLTPRNHGHAKSHATTTELMKKANALSPKIAFVFMGHRFLSKLNTALVQACGGNLRSLYSPVALRAVETERDAAAAGFVDDVARVGSFGKRLPQERSASTTA